VNAESYGKRKYILGEDAELLELHIATTGFKRVKAADNPIWIIINKQKYNYKNSKYEFF
jgi:hypothetical protein